MSPAADVVVLVHGLWLHASVLLPLQSRLEGAGFACRRFSYPSVRRGLDANADALGACVAGIAAPRIHLLGHSLGGLVILRLLAGGRHPRVVRALLLGVPCRGSRAAAVLLGIPFLRGIVGRSIGDWQESPQALAPDDVETGVVAGRVGIGLGRIIPGLPAPNDGVVAVAETRLDGATDSIVLAVTHTQMLVSRHCATQAAAFLRNGRFVHAPPT